MKGVIVVLVVMTASCIQGRPEIGGDRKYFRDSPSQNLAYKADGSSLPLQKNESNRPRLQKDQYNYSEGGEIPVQLVFDRERETDAIVKEVSMDALFNHKNGRSENRVERSPQVEINSDDNVSQDSPSTVELYDNLYASTANDHNSHQDDMYNSYSNEYAQDAYDFNADDFNRALGIEARGGIKGSQHAAAAPPLDDPSIKATNAVKDIIAKLRPHPFEYPENNQGVRRRIQHYQTLVQPFGHVLNGQGALAYQYQNPIQVSFYPPYSPATPLRENYLGNRDKIFDDYFPVVVNNPFNAIWTAFTNIIEYGPEAEICKKEVKSRRKRGATASNNGEFSMGDFGKRAEAGPQIMKLRVRQGGVAIAGPGGIATAGSGGTAIVGPGGTAYTTQDGTAVVGPGGRVIQVPSFTPSSVLSRIGDHSHYIPFGGKLIAYGPYIYYPTTSVERQ